MPIEFTKSSQDFESYLKSNKVLVANFTAAWCGPCQQIKPVVDKAYDTFSNVEIVRVDLDRQEELARKYSVSSIPTFIFFEDGTEKTRVSGANVQQLLTNLDTFNAKASGATRKGNGKAAAASLLLSSKSYKEIRPLIPSGFEILNSSIDFGSFEALNVKSVYKNKEVKLVFKAGEEEKEMEMEMEKRRCNKQHGYFRVRFPDPFRIFVVEYLKNLFDIDQSKPPP
ncbi:conserved hypothetical protein [Lodderomyces elongisporus NRRL YB-4239]|uniref:Thioredoxin domain-containing protein n=1 Tax=Lodderomyces elongisporus (strain ATCC 11503 / CBS 2605 / JCM 1781 / NBRC 1676 / NRRL YB-4239) TaxID=379508 RepID=A5DVL8_LODEL|nr:conserved hypothetical protein [Lodderomyces elongisporus NRRL YB-4239]